MQKTCICSAESTAGLIRNGEFAEYRRQYEFYAAAWLEAHDRGDQQLAHKSAEQILRALRGMYRLAQS
jgi:hypothetical protein